MKCIIVEGPQGVGKSSITNYLRDNLEVSNLYRLTGSKDKTITGKEKSKAMYDALLRYMESLEQSEVNLIFDRTFFTDYVYSKLGYKEYDYEDIYLSLLERLNDLNYEIYYISLYLNHLDLYEERLKRKHHHYQAFSLENSVNQQNMYKSIIPSIKEKGNIQVYEIATDDFKEAYKKINEIFDI